MSTSRFDTFARRFADRHSRRATIGGGLGLAATAIGGRVLAQEGTPQVATPTIDSNDPHPSADDAQSKPEFLFVQPFDSGTWAPKDGEDGVYTLTLSGAAAQTIYFSDRPERVVGLSPMEDFLDGLGFTPANPPNAAVVAQTDDGEQDILVIELLSPSYNAETATLTYDARVLADYGEPGLANLARQQVDFEMNESFGTGSVFIDGCSDGVATCFQEINGQAVAVGEISNLDCCWQSTSGSCGPCSDDQWAQQYGKSCHEAFPDTCNYYSGSSPNGWDCYAWDLFCTD